MQNTIQIPENVKGQFNAALSPGKTGKILSVFLFASVFLGGLFPYWCGLLAGAFLVCLLWIVVRKRGSLVFPKTIPAVSVFVAVAFYLLSVLWAVDRGMALLGFFKYLPIALFLCLCAGLEDEKERLFQSAAMAGVASVAICLPLSFIPALGRFLRPDGRFSGPFMYANTYGLFLLACIVILFTKKQVAKRDFFFCGILIPGILTTGSRSLFVLLALTMAALLFVNWRAVCAAAGIGAAATALASLGASGSLQRASEVSFSAGEWLTRLAYYYDGVRLLPGSLFGRGHLGWWYIQPQIQTSVYDARFIHCWPLQVALDIGVFPALLLIFSAFLLLFSKKVDLRGRLLLILIAGHALIDFDLEFLPVAFLLVLIIPNDGKENISLNKGAKRWLCTAALLAAGLSVWLGTASLVSYLGEHNAAVAIYPYYTEAMEAIELRESDPLKAEKWADRILLHNPLVYEAYNVKAKAFAREKDWLEAVRMKRSFLSIYRLEGKEYDEYLMYIYAALQKAAAEDDVDTCIQLVDWGLSVPKMMESVQKGLGPFTYRIKHQPTLALSIQSQNFLNYLGDYQKRLKTVKEALNQ